MTNDQRPLKIVHQKIKKMNKQPIILIVEDTEIIMYLLKSFIKKTIPGAEIIEATGAEEGVSKYKNFKPGIVLLNIQLPEKNGYYVAEEIRNYESKYDIDIKPIIAITARNTQGEKENCMDYGMNDFLAKPVEKELLAYTINKHLPSSDSKHDKKPADKQYKPEKSESVHFDKKGFLKRLDGSMIQYQELTSMAIPHLSEYVLNLQHAINNKDFNDIEQKAHKLNGAALFMCFYQLAELAKKIEYSDKQDIELIKSYFLEIEREFEEVKRALSGESESVRG